jgi:hypothetical protein
MLPHHLVLAASEPVTRVANSVRRVTRHGTASGVNRMDFPFRNCALH